MAEMNGAKGPQIKRREVWLELHEEYEGFKFLAWVNAPAHLWATMHTGTEEDRLERVGKIVREHNGWQDFDGNPYPPATDPEFWRQIPTDLAAAVLTVARQESQQLPNYLAPRKKRR